jgi:trimethylamine--corrinoid protein Co-methyltransferase
MSKKPLFKIFTDEEVQSIHFAILEVLERTGVKIMAPRAVEILHAHGCRIDRERVFIPSYLVEEAIQKAPKRFRLYDREGNPAFEVGGKESHFGTGPTTPYVLDVRTGERRPTRVDDIADAARVCDALKNIEWIMPLGSAQDVTPGVADVYEFEAAVVNTNKPIAFISSGGQGVRDVVQMAATARGDMQSLIQKPFIVAFPEPICPLVHPKDAVEEILAAAETGIPLAYFPGPMTGATSPVTLAGTIVLAMADALTGLVIAQLVHPGNPMVLGIAVNVMDMSTGALCCGPPEFSLGNAAHAEVLQYYGLPSWGTAGLTDSKIVDEQAAVESTFSCVMNALAGLNMVHDSGYMEIGMCGSIDMVVLTDEILNMVRRVLRGIEVNLDTLAVQVIDAVGPGGNFLTEDHTLRYCREETTLMKMMDRSNFAHWKEKGGLTLGRRINARSRELLAHHEPPQLEESKRKEISAIRKRSVSERTR